MGPWATATGWTDLVQMCEGGSALAQRPGLAAVGAALLGAGGAEASCRKIRSLRRRVHRSSSLASGPASGPGSLGPRDLRALRPFSAASLALSGLLGPGARAPGAARAGPGHKEGSISYYFRDF